jgi:hypothetical protein
VERLKDIDVNNARIIVNDEVGDVIPKNYQIVIGKDTIAFIYQPIACHSYNQITVREQKIKIATIDTMLSYYLAFVYAEKKYYNVDRILCMANYLFELQQKNRLSQKGLLKRFNIICYGHQKTIEEIRSDKAQKFRDLKHDRQGKEFQEWFLSYRPAEIKIARVKTKNYGKLKNKYVKTLRVQSKKNGKNKKRTQKKRGFFF